MKNLKIAISAPVIDNIYSFMVAKSCISEPGVEVVGVFALKLWSLKRIVNEFIRLRSRLLIKIWQKYFSESSKSRKYKHEITSTNKVKAN